MTKFVGKHLTQRHQLRFDHVPTVRGSFYGGSVTLLEPRYYAAVLDSVYEMADAISNGNGVTPEAAIAQVLSDERWRVLPRHQSMIAARLKS